MILCRIRLLTKSIIQSTVLKHTAFKQAYSTSPESSITAAEREFTELRLQSGLNEWRNDPQHVLVVHPKIRWGANSVANEEVERKVDEACALVRTLPGFTVAGSMTIGTDYGTKKKLIWGEGRLEALKGHQERVNATAVMINVDILSPLQQASLSEVLHVPVFDRYIFVLRIFKFYARTKEAYLQIALAEIPYIKQRLFYSDKYGASTDTLHINHAKTTLFGRKADKFEVLRLREHSLRKKVRALIDEKTNDIEMRKLHELRKAGRQILVAVVGYTNTGKTTLIKNLTGAEHICGENRLFATLDTTVHPAVLPSRSRVLLADTIGFISDLPIELISAFEATLRHVVNADLLIHVQDLSDPNVDVQRQVVINTLEGLKVRKTLLDTMITVGNKMDKLSFDEVKRFKDMDDMIAISARTGKGFPVLIDKLDAMTQLITGSKARRFRLKPGSQLVSYLYAEKLVAEAPEEDEKGNLVFTVKMTDEQFARLEASLKRSGKRIRNSESTSKLSH